MVELVLSPRARLARRTEGAYTLWGEPSASTSASLLGGSPARASKARHRGGRIPRPRRTGIGGALGHARPRSGAVAHRPPGTVRLGAVQQWQASRMIGRHAVGEHWSPDEPSRRAGARAPRPSARTRSGPSCATSPSSVSQPVAARRATIRSCIGVRSLTTTCPERGRGLARSSSSRRDIGPHRAAGAGARAPHQDASSGTERREASVVDEAPGGAALRQRLLQLLEGVLIPSVLSLRPYSW